VILFVKSKSVFPNSRSVAVGGLSKFDDPENAICYYGGVSQNLWHRKGTMKRSGSITCAKCGSGVGTSSKVYGGLMRMVCLNENCQMSEQNYYKEGK
jgi:hypothetical protein